MPEERYTIFLNTRSDEAITPPELENYFKYINGDDVDASDEFIREIHDLVVKVNQSPDWRDSMKTLREEVRLEFADDIKAAYDKAYEKAKKEIAEELVNKATSEAANITAKAKAELLITLVRNGTITLEQAKSNADDPEALDRMLSEQE